jgi:hypothetical protein
VTGQKVFFVTLKREKMSKSTLVVGQAEAHSDVSICQAAVVDELQHITPE